MKDINSNIKTIKQSLLSEINARIDKTPGLMTEFGVGKVGYDFSEPHKFYELVIFYDAKNDSLIIEYKDLNSIVNDSEISICVEKEDIRSDVIESMKLHSFSDLEENN